jgi:hypothetical protein
MKVCTKKNKFVVVDSYAAASAAVRAAWGNGRGSAFYADKSAGLVWNDSGVIAHVSFNGRVWAGASRLSVGNTEIEIGVSE